MRTSLLVCTAVLSLAFTAAPFALGQAETPAPAPTAKELLPNPGFETASTTGYRNHGGGGKLQLVAAPVHGGDFSCLVSNRTKSWDGVATYDPVRLLRPGHTYQASVWVRLPEGVADHNFYLQFDWQEPGKKPKYPSVGGATVSASRWTKIGGLFTLAGEVPPERLALYVCSADGNVEDFFVDDFSLVETEAKAEERPPITELPTAPAASVRSEAWVNYADTQQQVDGFGVSSAWRTLADLERRDEALDLLFDPDKGIGLSILRVMVPPTLKPAPGVPIVWASDADQTWTARQAAKRGVSKVMATVWSPPVWMKDNKNKVGGSVDPAHYQDYADFLSEYARGYKGATGLDLYAISMANEPDIAPNYDGCRWTGPQIRDFIKNYVRPTFARDGVTAKFIAAEDMNFSESLLVDTLRDPDAAAGLDIAAVHGYSSGFSPLPDAVAQGKPVWMTEVLGYHQEDYGIRDGLVWAKRIARHFGEAGVSAWNYWWMAGKGNSNLLYSNPDKNELWPAKRYFALGAYAKFVKPGWFRVGATLQPNKDVFLTAFKDEVSHQVVLVAVNTNVNDQDVDVHLNGFQAGALEAWRTSTTENLAAVPAPGVEAGVLRLHLAAQSWTTVRASSVSPAPGTPVTPAMGTTVTSTTKRAQAARGTPALNPDDPAWSRAPSVTLDLWGEGTHGTENAAATVQLLWDEGHLYVRATVDKQGLPLSKLSKQNYIQDSFETFVDESHARNPGFYDQNDSHYNVTYDGTKNYFSEFCDKVGFQALTRVAPSGTAYVVVEAVPVHRPLAVGTVLGFEAQVNSEIAVGTRNILKWATASGSSYLDPSTFGEVELTD